MLRFFNFTKTLLFTISIQYSLLVTVYYIQQSIVNKLSQSDSDSDSECDTRYTALKSRSHITHSSQLTARVYGAMWAPGQQHAQHSTITGRLSGSHPHPHAWPVVPPPSAIHTLPHPTSPHGGRGQHASTQHLLRVPQLQPQQPRVSAQPLAINYRSIQQSVVGPAKDQVATETLSVSSRACYVRFTLEVAVVCTGLASASCSL